MLYALKINFFYEKIGGTASAQLVGSVMFSVCMRAKVK